MSELVVVENELVSQRIDPAKVFCPNGLEPIIVAIEKKAREFELDATTAKGRASIGSLGQKVASSKVLLDNTGKKYVEELKAKIKPVDAERKRMRDRLDSLKQEILKPRDEWEAEERAKIEAEEAARQFEIDHAEALEMNSLFDREREVARKEAEIAKAEEERRQKEEAERKAKEQAEREKRIAKEATARAKKEAEEEKIRAVEAAERKAKEEADRIERERLEAETKQKAKEQAERLAAEKKAANAKHRAKINSEAINFIKGIYGTTEKQASGIVSAIANNEVPHISIKY